MTDQNVLYRFYNRAGELLYIGITNDPWRRFSQHRHDKDWWSEVSNICQQSFNTTEELKSAEKRAIQRENPRHNKQFASATEEADGATVSQLPAPNRGLVGKFFHSWEKPPWNDPKSIPRGATDIVKNGRYVAWQGRIVNQVAPGRYLVELFSWWDGCASEQRIVTVARMTEWTFYDNNIEMIAALGCGEHIWTNDHRDRGRCGNAVVGIAGRSYNLTSAVCASCAKCYADVEPIEQLIAEQLKKGNCA